MPGLNWSAVWRLWSRMTSARTLLLGLLCSGFLLPVVSVAAANVSWPFTDLSPWQRDLTAVENLQCQRPDAVQVWLPAAAQAAPAIRLFTDWHRHPLAASQSCFAARFIILKTSSVKPEASGNDCIVSCRYCPMKPVSGTCCLWISRVWPVPTIIRSIYR